MKRSLQIGSAFVGLIVGAGFASGQEVMQYFTSFGMWGLAGGVVATFLFMFLGYTFAQLGSDMGESSHRGVIHQIGGKYLGPIFDLLITFFLFGVAVVMFAGSGSTFEQMFGITPMVGSMIMVTLTILTLLLDSKKVINMIAMVTPYLIAIILIILVYSIFTMNISFAEADVLAQEQPSAASNWLLGAFLYVSYNIAAGAALLIVMSGGTKDRKVAGRGGLIGGAILGGLIILIHFGMYVKMDVVGHLDMPTLELASQIHPFVGILMALALLGMMYNTSVGMLYSFSARIVTATTRKKYNIAVVIIGILGFFASLLGFTTLVGEVYALMGYLGFALIIAAVLAWFRKRKEVVAR